MGRNITQQTGCLLEPIHVPCGGFCLSLQLPLLEVSNLHELCIDLINKAGAQDNLMLASSLKAALHPINGLDLLFFIKARIIFQDQAQTRCAMFCTDNIFFSADVFAGSVLQHLFLYSWFPPIFGCVHFFRCVHFRFMNVALQL